MSDVLKLEVTPNECGLIVAALCNLELDVNKFRNIDLERMKKDIASLQIKIRTEIIEQKLIDGTKCPIHFKITPC